MKLSTVSISILSAALSSSSAFAPAGNSLVANPLAAGIHNQWSIPLFAAGDDKSTEASTEVDEFALDALKVAGAVNALAGETIVVKYGGNAMTSEDLAAKFCQDVAALQKLGVRVIVVHGGGPQIRTCWKRLVSSLALRAGCAFRPRKLLR